MAERVIGLLEAVPWLRRYAGSTFVVKVGGELLDDARWRDGLARDVAVLHRVGIGVVVVHGGGPQLDRAAAAAGLESERVAGRRITSPELVDLAIAEWSRVSAAFVSALAAQDERAVGLMGFEGGLVAARRRPPVQVTDDDGTTRRVDYGRVGDVIGVDPKVLRAVASTGAIPVITPLCGGEGGEVLNVNADTVAAEVAVALGASKLVVCTRAPGILRDPDDATSVLPQTDLTELAALEASGALHGGMRPKVAALRRALNGGVPRAHVVDGRQPGALLEEVFTAEGSGTLVQA